MSKNTESTGQNVIVNVQSEKSEGKRNKYQSIVKDTVDLVANASMKALFKIGVVATVFVVLYTSYKFVNAAINNDAFINAVAHSLEQDDISTEEQRLNIRTNEVTPKIQNELEKLCYSINADRAFLFELHNGKKNASGLPFRYADMSYEEVNDEKNGESVALQFQDIPLTLYKYPHYLAQHRYIYGSVDEIAEIDNGFAKHIERIGGKYLGMVYLTARGLPLGFLCVSFHAEPSVSSNVIRNKLEQYGKVITPLLDLNSQLKK